MIPIFLIYHVSLNPNESFSLHSKCLSEKNVNDIVGRNKFRFFFSFLLADQCPRMQAPTDSTRFNKKSLCIRMRSSLTKRAPNMKTPGYRVRYFFSFFFCYSVIFTLN